MNSNYDFVDKFNKLMHEISISSQKKTSNLSIVENRKNDFDFYKTINEGKTLFIGEGNFSFSLSIAEKIANKSNIIATCFEKEKDLSDFAISNINKLKSFRININFEIDATEINQTFRGYQFDNIIFNFPNTGSREAVEGRNSNFISLRDFLISGKKILKKNGKIIVSIIDSAFYQGAFQIEEASNLAGFKKIEIYNFNPLIFKNYKHQMTNEKASAVDKNDNCITIIFSDF